MSEKKAKEKRRAGMLSITPPVCPACELDPEKAKAEGFDSGFLMFSIPNSGVAHFVCPRCCCVMMNRECFENQAIIRSRSESRIIVP